MISATMHEAKTNLSDLVERACAGEEVILTRGRNREPVAKVVPIEPVKVQRLGALAHLGIQIPDSFWDPLPEEELRLWEGEEE